jgi:hypothetical protein
MYVKELWRYPIKSMAGEAVRETEILRDGLRGDRLVQVYGPRGVLTSRTRPGLLGLRGTLGPDDEPLVNGHPWSSPQAHRLVTDAAGPGSRLAFDSSVGRFDILPLLVATDGAIAAFGRDGRRLRPNLVIGGVDGLAERRWPGGRLQIGACLIALDSLRDRCIMTTFDPDDQRQDVEVLRDIRARFDGKLALNAAVLTPGAIGVGDPVQLVEPSTCWGCRRAQP